METESKNEIGIMRTEKLIENSINEIKLKLNIVFNEKAYIILDAQSCLNPYGIVEWLNRFFVSLKRFIEMDEGSYLKKPIIVIGRQFSNSNRWQSLIILPKSYLFPFNKNNLENEGESIYFTDDCFLNSELFSLLKFLFKNQIKFSCVRQCFEKKKNLIGGIFPKSKIHENIKSCRQMNNEKLDSLSLSIFISYWIMHYGYHDFLCQDDERFISNYTEFLENFGLEELDNNFSFISRPFSNGVSTSCKHTKSFFRNLKKSWFGLKGMQIDSDIILNITENYPSNFSDSSVSKFLLDSPLHIAMNLKMLCELKHENLAIKEEVNIQVPGCRFKKFRNYFCIISDKTDFIKDVLEITDKHILITRPRGWGKTFNLEMLEEFLKIEKSEEKLNIKKKIFEGGETFRKGTKISLECLKISQYKSIIDTHCGQYPVIYISFWPIKCTENIQLENFIVDIAKMIKRAYIKHHNLYRKILCDLNTYENSTDESIVFDNRLRTQFKERYHIYSIYSDTEPENSLKILCEILYFYYKKNVIIIVDDYDCLLSNATDKNCHETIVQALQIIFAPVWKNDSKIEKIIMAGNTKADLGSMTNSFREFGILNSEFSKNFGLGENEVKEILDKCLECPTQTFELSLKLNHGGYNIENQSICNTLWSIYWIKCAKPNYYPFIHNAVDIIYRQHLDKVLKNMNNTKILDELIINGSIIYQGVDSLTMWYPWKTDENNFFALLLHNGYIAKDQINPDRYIVPNLGIYNFLLEAWLYKNLGNADYRESVKSLILSLGDIRKFRKRLNNFLKCGDYFKSCKRSLWELKRIIGAAIIWYETWHNDLRHIMIPEYLQKIDALFIPVRNRSSVLIIHNYMLAEKIFDNREYLEDGLWKIYVKRFLSITLDLLNSENLDYIKHVIVRSIVFDFIDSEAQWKVDIRSQVFSINNARQLDTLFSKNGQKVDNWKNLIVKNNRYETDYARHNFLRSANANSLENMLESFFELKRKPEIDEEEKKESLKRVKEYVSIINKN